MTLNLPEITIDELIGAIATFKIVTTNNSSTNNVTLSPASGNYIYLVNSDIQNSSYILYDGDGTSLNYITLCVLKNNLGSYGWYQIA